MDSLLNNSRYVEYCYMCCTRCKHLILRYKKIGNAKILGPCKRYDKRLILIPFDYKVKNCPYFEKGQPDKWKPEKRKPSVKRIVRKRTKVQK